MLRAQSLAIKLNSAIKNVNLIRNISPIANGTKKTILTKYFLATNLMVSTTASGLGDFIEQMFEIFSKYQKQWDKTRTAKMAFTGLPVGLICHHFYIILDKYFSEKSLKVILKKIVLCQIVCSPLCIVTFYLTLGRLNNWSNHKTYNNILEKGSQVFLAEWMVWPPALVFSFLFLSTRYRVLYDNCISLGFDIFNSYLVHKELRNK